MLGYPRILIANECHISTGAVSSIAAEWKYTVGPDLANLIRGIGVTLRKLRMSPAQCMTGLRVANLVDRIGLDEDSIEAFLSDVYTRLQEAGVNPKHIARYVEELLSLVDGGNNNQQTVISLHDIDRVFERKRQDKIKLEQEYKVSETKVLQMQQEASLNEKALAEVLLRKNKVELDMKWKSELVDELRKRELTIDDLFGLVGASQFFKERGFNVAEMFMTFSSYKKMEGEIVNQQKQLAALNKRILEVEQESKFQEELLLKRD